MMYDEFIKATQLGYMTEADYHSYIEPVYMDSDLDKAEFCKRFYKAHNEYVNRFIDMLIHSKSIAEKEAYIAGAVSWSDVEQVHQTIKKIFLKALYNSKLFRKECSI